MRKIKSLSSGFTIVELMIATAVFSIVLLVCTTGLIQIGRLYQRGVIRSQTQEIARSAMANIAESIQFSNGTVAPLDSGDGYCIGSKRISFIKDKNLSTDSPIGSDQTALALFVDTGSCSVSGGPAAPGTAGDELLAPNMRVVDLTINNITGSNLYTIDLKIAYGDMDLVDSSSKNCREVRFAGSFCATSNLITTVQKRIK